MDEVKSLNDSANKGAIPTAFQQKKWVKKLDSFGETDKTPQIKRNGISRCGLLRKHGGR